MKQILTIYFFFIFISSAAAEPSINIKCNDDHMTAEISNAPIKDVLKKIKEDKGLLFSIEDSLLNEKISVSFKNMEFSEAVKRILKPFNYALVFDKNGSLKKVNVVAIGDSVNMNNRHISEPESPDAPAHVEPPEVLLENIHNKIRRSPSANKPTPEELEAMNPGAGEPPEIGPGTGNPPEVGPGAGKPSKSGPDSLE